MPRWRRSPRGVQGALRADARSVAVAGVGTDIADVARLDVEPGELPRSMTAWVLRREREGALDTAYEIEEVEVPEPGPFEVVVRVMAAGFNINIIWAALAKPI